MKKTYSRIRFKLPAVNTEIALSSAFNVGRNLANPLFIAVITYLFLRQGHEEDLLKINKVTTLCNLILVFSGWGLRDFLLKDSARQYTEFNKNWHLAFYSKFVLLVPLAVISLFCFPKEYLLFIVFIAIARTFNSLYESVIILYKKSAVLFILELFLSVFIVLLVYAGAVVNYVYYFWFLLFAELFKLVFNAMMFKKPEKLIFPFLDILAFLKETKFYFFIVILSFFQSRIDLYLLGFFFNPGDFNEYQLLLSLISLSQIVIASFVVSYVKLFYRNVNQSMLTFRKIVFSCGFSVAFISTFLIYGILNFIYYFNFTAINACVVFLNVCFFSWVLYEMYHYNKLKWFGRMLGFMFVSGVINVIVCGALIPKLGIMGALSGNSIAQLLLSVLMTTQRQLILKRETH